MALSDLLIPVLLVGASLLLARHELGLVREHQDESEFFVYSRRRLRRRLFGAGVLAATGVTLAVWELVPKTPNSAAALVAALFVELIALVATAIFDLVETARPSRPGGPSARPSSTTAAPDRRTRTRSGRPR